MGYIGNFIGVGALIPLPFAGLSGPRDLLYNEQMGISMMGGIFLAVHHPGRAHRRPLPVRQFVICGSGWNGSQALNATAVGSNFYCSS